MPKVSEIKYKYLDKLEKSGIDRAEAIAELDLVIKHLCDCSTKDIVMDFELSNKETSGVENFLNERILSGKPIQQILGIADFCGEKLFVNEHTLIPRPETEILVAEAIEILKQYEQPKVLDIGTGSGNIACCIAKEFEDIEVIGVDISSKALQVALKNAEKLGVTKRAMFRKSNIFSNVSEKFDMIVSNPPYIPISQKESLQKEVKNFEPSLALFAEDEKGIKFYKSIIEDASNYLNLEGYLLFEIGINQSEIIQDLLVQNYFRVIDVKKDLNNIDRVIIAQID